jgi:hypothetical protein
MAKKVKSGDDVFDPYEAEAAAKEAQEKFDALSKEERAAEFFKDHPRWVFDSILMTADKSIFHPTIGGRNAADNHAKTLKGDQNVYEMLKNPAPTADVDRLPNED